MKDFRTRLYVADIAPLFDKTIYDKWYAIASSDRVNKVAKLKNEADKVRSIAAWALVNLAYENMNEDFGLNAGTLPKIKNADNGKPYFIDSELKFNISHSGNRVLCAISDGEVGCDVEHKSDKYDKIAKRFFTANEYSYIMAGDNKKECSRRFTLIWTLKESVLKASGYGVSHMTSDFSCVADDGQLADSIWLPDNNTRYYWWSSGEEKYKYSICTTSDNIDERIYRVEL